MVSLTPVHTSIHTQTPTTPPPLPIHDSYHSSGSGRFDVILRDREPAHARGGATGANRGTPVPQAMGWRPVLMGFGGRMAPLIVGGRPGVDIEPNSETDTDESGSEYSGDEEDIMWG